ncbi:RluA family pseudouridine synthase [Gudongella sp. DL1XJH-153]|uniref:RluA family pseudouridine synthase n=1 Tax=Gudongella sp. DL1XJH-153 TaxID=3409804 RepID=UPI003BB5C198
MRELRIERNDSQQRLDRFLKKYLADATQGFIYKMIRKKNIKVNEKKAVPDMMLEEGDVVQLYLAEDTIEKFRGQRQHSRSRIDLDIVYEDENIVLINKPVGLLSHGTGEEFQDNVVDALVGYLIDNGDYVPRVEKTFTPSICNRLDRNTSGIIVGAKNYQSLQLMNQAIKEGMVAKFYKTIVRGTIKKDFEHKAFLTKDEERNKVQISDDDSDGGKEIWTRFKVLKNSRDYTMLEVELITGRTHQIRSSLSSLGYPVIGDRKYGDRRINEEFKQEYDLTDQWLHGYRLIFDGLEEPLDYLNNKEFTADVGGLFKRIEREIF